MAKLQPARGTRDIIGPQARTMRRVVECFLENARLFGFEELATPVFEFAEVYKRPLGEASDIVAKEMYTFEDRGGEALTLRPEFTAGICRAFISGGMQQNVPCRLASHGPVFRYERPQKGRYRQFHQINAEIIGPDDPLVDVDLISLAHKILTDLGLVDRTVFHINSLGDTQSRLAYRESLVDYFEQYRSDLSPDSQQRLQTNPLRILDSKDAGDRKIIDDAPRISDSLTKDAQAFFDQVRHALDKLGIAYLYDERLVRGLDYYNHTAFEFITDQLGAQGTVIGGGRYNGLIEQLGGQPTAAVGWAGGIERLALMLVDEGAARNIIVMPLADNASIQALSTAMILRRAGAPALVDTSGNLKKKMNRANKANARFAILMGESEIAADNITVKDLDTGDQQTISLRDFIESHAFKDFIA